MRIDVVTLFPELVTAVVESGIPRRASESGLLELVTWNPRDFARDRHRTVDDRPYGGGPGMIMQVQPLRDAIQAARQDGEAAKVICLSPQGRRLDQPALQAFAGHQRLILVAGRYEGIDERLLELEVDEEWSIGDYVISGGELAAMIVIDGVTRLLPGALGDESSAVQDSFSDGLLECPQYTRPDEVDGLRVPQTLLAGNHADIRRWREQQALGRTWLRRPDMLDKLNLSTEQRDLLDEFIKQYKAARD